MEANVSEVLENILSMLSLEGSFEVEEKEEGVFVTIDTKEPGKLIGHQGETLSSLQLLINQILLKQTGEFKRVIIDVSGWRQSKEEELAHRARQWAQEVLETGEELELEPMPAWQRRIVHMTIEGTQGVRSESVGEGSGRHLVIMVESGKETKGKRKKEVESNEKKGQGAEGLSLDSTEENEETKTESEEHVKD